MQLRAAQMHSTPVLALPAGPRGVVVCVHNLMQLGSQECDAPDVSLLTSPLRATTVSCLLVSWINLGVHQEHYHVVGLGCPEQCSL
jgi:hypothetical protein